MFDGAYMGLVKGKTHWQLGSVHPSANI